MQQQNQGKETSGNTRIFKIILPIIAIVAILTTAAILFGPYISHAVKKLVRIIFAMAKSGEPYRG